MARTAASCKSKKVTTIGSPPNGGPMETISLSQMSALDSCFFQTPLYPNSCVKVVARLIGLGGDA